MNILITTIQTIIKRPFIILFSALLMLVCTILNNYNPIMPIILGLNNMTGESIFESMVSLLQIILDPGFIPGMVLFLLGFALAASLIAGVVFSGYMNIINKTLEHTEKTAGDFIEGVKKYFFRVFLATLRVLLSVIFLAIFMMIVCVPAIVVTKAAVTGKPELMVAALFIDFLTAGVLFFVLLFTSSYVFFWYPAIFKGGKKPFSSCKQIVDRYFWGIAGRLLVFDIVFAVFQYLVITTGNSVLKFISGWIFGTFFLVTLLIYIFSSFNDYYKTV